jgi:NAD(P)-dependent dehydrogenase (short-subunit alcohol dehydrogenase family)
VSLRTLDGPVAVVRGAGRGIGVAIARRLAHAGARVAVVARTQAAIDAVAAEIVAAGGDAAAIACDVSDEAAVAALPQAVERALGPAAILAHSAGAAASAPLAKIALADWRAMIDQNATSAFLCARAFAPILVERGAGRIVFVASIAGLGGARYLAHYTAAKHAVVGLMRALAAEFDGTGVTVNAICPGYVDTPMTERTLANVEQRARLDREAALAAVLASASQGRLLSPDEVADEVVALCHPEASAVNGQAIVLHPRTATT